MPKEISEKAHIGLKPKQWEIFFKRLKEQNADVYMFIQEFRERSHKLWDKISPEYGEKFVGYFDIREDGKLRGSPPFYVMLAVLFEIFNEEISKIRRYLKYTIPEFDSLIECPFCHEYNPPDVSFCIYCNKSLPEVENEERQE